MKKNGTTAKNGIDIEIQEQNFQISLTYLHSFKLESNDKTPDFFLQNFLRPAGGPNCQPRTFTEKAQDIYCHFF